MCSKYVSILVLTLSLVHLSYAGNAETGREKSSRCTTCHGVSGMSSMRQTPNLAGQNESYFIKAMKAYRDGGRKDPMMGVAAKALSDDDIENLAAYYKGIK